MSCLVKGEDEKYRWRYDLSLFKNPTILFLLWKIFGFICFGIYIFNQLISINDSIHGWKEFLNDTKFFALFALGMMVLCLVGYLIYAAMMGGKYCIEFTMDEDGIEHRQVAVQAKKAKRIGMATAVIGAAGGKPGVTGSGIMAATKTSMYSDFSNVKSIKAYPRRHLIKLNERLGKNQVYVKEEDYEFVLEFIKERCTKAKVK